MTQIVSFTKIVTVSPAPLSASFTYSPSSPVVGTQVSFVPSVTGGTTPYAYSWGFGDGTTSTSILPKHVFSTQGSFAVKLTVTG